MQREYVCHNPACPNNREVASATPLADQPHVQCETCGKPMEIALYPISVVFTGVITARYNDKKLENAHQEGHWAWDKDPVTGKSTPTFIETFDDQRAFCKRNKLINPKDAPNNFQVAEDGRTIESTRGLPGSWV